MSDHSIREQPAVPASRFWRYFWRSIESAGIAALITVIIGGGLLSYVVQRAMSERAFQQARLQRESDFRQAWMKDVVRGTFDLAGRSIGAAEDVLLLCDPDIKHAITASQGNRLITNFNAAEGAWRSQKETQALLLGFYSGGNEKIVESWREQSRAIDELLVCADNTTRAPRMRERLQDQGQRCQESLA